MKIYYLRKDVKEKLKIKNKKKMELIENLNNTFVEIKEKIEELNKEENNNEI